MRAQGRGRAKTTASAAGLRALAALLRAMASGRKPPRRAR